MGEMVGGTRKTGWTSGVEAREDDGVHYGDSYRAAIARALQPPASASASSLQLQANPPLKRAVSVTTAQHPEKICTASARGGSNLPRPKEPTYFGRTRFPEISENPSNRVPEVF